MLNVYDALQTQKSSRVVRPPWSGIPDSAGDRQLLLLIGCAFAAFWVWTVYLPVAALVFAVGVLSSGWNSAQTLDTPERVTRGRIPLIASSEGSGTIVQGRRFQRRPFAAQQEPCDDDDRQH